MFRRYPKHSPLLGVLVVLALGSSRLALAGGQSGSLIASPLITEQVDAGKLVRLAGHTHPLAVAKYDQGAVPDSFAMEHMFLQLKRGPVQEQALESLMRQQQAQGSAERAPWLTADELGHFGPAQSDIDAVVQFLKSYGFQVNGVTKSGLIIDFSGTAGQVAQAFHTEIHNYNVRGEQHIANAIDPSIPVALAPVVTGVVSLHNFLPKPMLRRPSPNFSFPLNGVEQFDIAPADFATIYNVNPLYNAKKPITGKGQTVVVLEDGDINPADVATFRTAFGLTSFKGTFTQIHPGTGCTDPGTNGTESEAALDAEWAGAIAPDATVELASCADTTTNFGGFIAAQNLLDSKTPPPIMSLSFGNCEANLGPSGNAFVNALWQQAASEGVSVFVSAGDGAAAGCDNFDNATFATAGIAASGFASTPYNVATGGTDFHDTIDGTNNVFWSTTNSATGKSAKSYIPEIPWNDSCANSILFGFFGFKDGVTFCNSTTGAPFLNIVGGSGAPSFVYAKPFWQVGVVGVPNDGKRDLPDISLFASNGIFSHAILFCMSDAAEGGKPCNYAVPADAAGNSAGGTSFTAPQFASIQALIDQKAGGPQGNPNPIVYDLARTELSNKNTLKQCNSSNGTAISPTCIFNDTTEGDNDVPCFGPDNCFDPSPAGFGVLSTSNTALKPAYPAHAGWDFATGLGSVNVTNLVNRWP